MWIDKTNRFTFLWADSCWQRAASITIFRIEREEPNYIIDGILCASPIIIIAKSFKASQQWTHSYSKQHPQALFFLLGILLQTLPYSGRVIKKMCLCQTYFFLLFFEPSTGDSLQKPPWQLSLIPLAQTVNIHRFG